MGQINLAAASPFATVYTGPAYPFVYTTAKSNANRTNVRMVMFNPEWTNKRGKNKMIKYSLNRILQTKQFWTVVLIMTVITTLDAAQHAVMLGGFSLAKSLWLNTFMASSVGGTYGHMLTSFVLGLFPVWLLVGAGFATLNDFSVGQSYSVVSRVGVAKYLRGQYLAAGVAGVLLFAIPLLVNVVVVFVIQTLNLKKYDGQMRLLIDRPRLPNSDKYHFVWWQLEHPALTFFMFLGIFLVAVFFTSMMMVSISLIFDSFYQVLTLVVLATVLLGSQLFDIGSLVQTFAHLSLFSDWITGWVVFITTLSMINVVTYLWRRTGELK